MKKESLSVLEKTITAEERIKSFLADLKKLMKTHGAEISLEESSPPNPYTRGEEQIIVTMMNGWKNKKEKGIWLDYAEINLGRFIDEDGDF